MSSTPDHIDEQSSTKVVESTDISTPAPSQPENQDNLPLIPQEDHVDHQFLFHNEHVRQIAPNTVTISGNGIVKTILRPGNGAYPLPRSLVYVNIVGKLAETGQIFQNSRDPAQTTAYRESCLEKIYQRFEQQRHERDAKAQVDNPDETDEERTKRLEQSQNELLEQFEAQKRDNRYEAYIQETSFQLNDKDAHVVRALQLTIPTMKVGEICTIAVKPDYAFGDIGIDDYIPDKSNVIFELELISAESRPVPLSEGLAKQYIRQGHGWNNPGNDSTCEIYIRGLVAVTEESQIDQPDDEIIQLNLPHPTRTFLPRTEYTLLVRIDDVMLPEGIERCLQTMKVDEIACFHINSNILLGDGFEPKRHVFPLDLPPAPTPTSEPDENLLVYYIIELVGIPQHVDLWSLSLSARLEETERLKECGNEFMRLGLQMNQIVNITPSYTHKGLYGYFARAKQRYLQCLDVYEHFAEYEQKQCTYDMIVRVYAVQLACLNNCQIITMKEKNYPEVEKFAQQAIELFSTPINIYGEVKDKASDVTVAEDTTTTTTTTEQNTDETTANEDQSSALILPDATKQLLGKAFPKQTTANNIMKTFYRKAQAILLQNDPDEALSILSTCYFLWDEAEKRTEEEAKMLLHGVVPVNFTNDKNEDVTLPLCKEAYTIQLKNECDKLRTLIDKKRQQQQSRSRQKWAQALE